MRRDLVVHRHYPGHPQPRVWRAFTEPALLARWLMAVDGDPGRLGATFTLTTRPAPGFDGVVRGEVLAVEPPRRLVWRWRGGPVDTRLEVVLTPVDDGCTVTLAQRGFDGVAAVLASMVLDLGWRVLLRTDLPRLLDEME